MNLSQFKYNEARYHVFEREVNFRYQLFNGLFLSLPFQDVDKAGAMLAIFAKVCHAKLTAGKTVEQIIEEFFMENSIPKERQYPLLFKFLQFIERQVVLFDALEDAAFSQINDLSGNGTVDYLLHQLITDDDKLSDMFMDILKYYKIRVVLTAHPTQFYPNQILGIISELSKAIKVRDLDEIRNAFLQLGLTRFSNNFKPTPLDEAKSLIWYLENVFYNQMAKIQHKLPGKNINLELGFWPGGDRDGNPYVVAETTLKVAKKLRLVILGLYFKDLKILQQKLTFEGVHDRIIEIANQVIKDNYSSAENLINELEQIIIILNEKYQSMFVELVEYLILKIKLFNFYFAKLDIRQNSTIHCQVIHAMLKIRQVHSNYSELSDAQKIEVLKANLTNFSLINYEYQDNLITEVLATVKAIHTIQQENGLNAIERYIISNTTNLASIFEVIFLIELMNNYLQNCAANKNNIMDNNLVTNNSVNVTNLIMVEVVPLFETIDDLNNAPYIMEALYKDPLYQTRLTQQQQKQTIMLGFSDGTKDGGYLMANWAIYQAKKKLTQLSIKYNVEVVFFDGRGGPPSRGGGNTRDFYHALGTNIANREIQLTIQGQTISSNFGTPDSAIFNLEQLFISGVSAKLYPDSVDSLTDEEEQLITLLAEESYNAYLELRQDKLFIAYLEEITPLKYLASVNVGSRPTKRNQDDQLKFEDLRAIPFVGAWTQMKQNILGYYGLGSGISKLLSRSAVFYEQLRLLYRNSLFFKTLINNAMQSLSKSNFAISRHLEFDPKFGKFWCKLRDETALTKEMLLNITGHDELLSMDAIGQQSIKLREKIVLPLVVIQQYALAKLRQIEQELDNKSLAKSRLVNDEVDGVKTMPLFENDPEDRFLLERLIKKSLAANINASRNSV
ncbi:MAG: phosphoenolpyruvate carboxylase [Burkholderiales bacterium]|nr:phosphoenolpyruvate carboxylase [Burkholderiales bacterium]